MFEYIPSSILILIRNILFPTPSCRTKHSSEAQTLAFFQRPHNKSPSGREKSKLASHVTDCTYLVIRAISHRQRRDNDSSRRACIQKTRTHARARGLIIYSSGAQRFPLGTMRKRHVRPQDFRSINSRIEFGRAAARPSSPTLRRRRRRSSVQHAAARHSKGCAARVNIERLSGVRVIVVASTWAADTARG